MSDILQFSLLEMRKGYDLKEMGRKKPEQEGNHEANTETDTMEGSIFMQTAEKLTCQ